ncbi:MAG: PAS domain S-box protein [Desulfomonile tiedjei]|nr:PAS domain S-box protein [Desulfomonile tiedjei]
MDGQDTQRATLDHTRQIVARQPDWTERILVKAEQMVPDFLKPRDGFFFSFKNRILFSSLFLLCGVVIAIGVILEATVFPKLAGDARAVMDIKVIHCLVSLAIIAASWLFIGFISKKITLPLQELTKRADQISREAGSTVSRPTGCPEEMGELALDEADEEEAFIGDEIFQLTSSFNRMLVHLRASEACLRESEEKYRFLFDNAPTPIFVIDVETKGILDVNARAVEEYQYTREEFLEMHFADLGLDRDRQQISTLLKQVYSTETTPLPVLRHCRMDGSLFMANFHARMSTYCNRPAIVAAVWDVTEKLEKHAMLIQAGKMAMLGEMATGIAHELNQPLNVMRLGVDYLVKRIRTGTPMTPDEINRLRTELVSSVERASRIINHLREFGRKPEETMTPVDINVPIRNVFTLLGTQLMARGIRWDLDLDEDLPKILGDTNRLEQVFINLVLNARDALLSEEHPHDEAGAAGAKPETGISFAEAEFSRARRRDQDESNSMAVTIKSFLEDGRIIVTVSDTGPGIPAPLRSKVFQPFFTTKELGSGTGLGLSISYGIVKEHQGTIEVEATDQPGAQFRLTFRALDREK